MSNTILPVGGTSFGGGAESEVPAEQIQADAEALDAYSRTVSSVVERLAPSVASLRVMRDTRRGRVPVGADRNSAGKLIY